MGKERFWSQSMQEKTTLSCIVHSMLTVGGWQSETDVMVLLEILEFFSTMCGEFCHL